MAERAKPVIGISCGDLNGIGMEVIMKTLSHPDIFDVCTPIVFASSKVASYHRKALEMEDFNFHILKDISDKTEGKPNLVNSWNEEVILELGKLSAVVGSYALKSLDHACSALESGQIDALVTAPIHKESIQSDDFRFTGHTDYLEARFKGKATMLLVSEQLRMALATVHIPLREVSGQITEERLIERLNSLNDTLNRDFLQKKGKIAVLALNPHGGDGGVIGHEDDSVVSPAIRKAFDQGIMAFGPFPADGFFGNRKYKDYDAILAMYHDQGLIPFKLLSFGEGVNFTAGLKAVRTSPDHGTAFDIAGKNVADPSSFRKALFTAIDIARNRKNYYEAHQNTLVKKTDDFKNQEDEILEEDKD